MDNALKHFNAKRLYEFVFPRSTFKWDNLTVEYKYIFLTAIENESYSKDFKVHSFIPKELPTEVGAVIAWNTLDSVGLYFAERAEPTAKYPSGKWIYNGFDFYPQSMLETELAGIEWFELVRKD